MNASYYYYPLHFILEKYDHSFAIFASYKFCNFSKYYHAFILCLTGQCAQG